MIITAGIYKGRKISVPDENITRPTLSKTRMGVFNTLFSIIGNFEGMSFLDLFGGSGVMGLEALSRGFKDVKVFEKNINAARIIKNNYKAIGLKPNLYIGDSEKLIKKCEESFDVIYVDPPYESNLYEKIIPLCHSKIIIVEGLKNYVSDKYEIIKIKNYGGTFVTYLTSVK